MMSRWWANCWEEKTVSRNPNWPSPNRTIPSLLMEVDRMVRRALEAELAIAAASRDFPRNLPARTAPELQPARTMHYEDDL